MGVLSQREWLQHKTIFLAERRPFAQYQLPADLLENSPNLPRLAHASETEPISPDYLSGLGVGLLVNRVEQLMAELVHDLEHVGIVISRVGRPAEHKEQTVAALKKQFKELVLDTQLTERVTVSEAAATKTPIFKMGNAQASAEFTAVSKELLKRIGA